MLAVPIVCAINAAYGLPVRVMLASLRAHLGAGYRPELYLLHRGLPDELLAAISRDVQTHSIVLDAGTEAMIPRHRQFPREAAYPLLLGELLPETIERVLFLDADLLVLDDAAKIWEIDLGESVLAAAPDQAIPQCGSPRGVKRRRQLEIPDAAPYFNAGVMLIQLAKWRQRGIRAKAFEYLQSTGDRVDYLHQEALNAVLWSAWRPLEPRWNVLAGLTGRPYSRPGEDGRDPAIVHYAGRFKPWVAPVGGPFNEPYQRFLSQVRPGPSPSPNWRERLLSVYDRHLRRALYGCERALWERRLL